MDNNTYEHAFTRGEIYYVCLRPVVGSEQQAGRPAIIVSNDRNNTYSDTVEVVYLTTQPKNDLPTHVTIRSTQKVSTALCEQIHTVDVSRISDYIATCTDQELNAIDTALLISLGIEAPAPAPVIPPKPQIIEKEVIKEVPVEVVKEVEVIKEVPAENSEELIAAKAQIAQLQAMYDSLLERIMGR